MTIIIDGPMSSLSDLPDSCAELILVVIPGLLPWQVHAAAALARPKLRDGGAVIIGNSLPACIAKL